VLLPDGTNVNHALVKDGWCWWYLKYAPGDTVLEGLEKEAREGRRACGPIRSLAVMGVAKTGLMILGYDKDVDSEPQRSS
jgi:hypothetical protein